MLRRARLGDATEGVTAIEFAILLPFFIMIVLTIIQFSELIFTQFAMQHAVTQAARCASEFSSSGGSCATCSEVITTASNEADASYSFASLTTSNFALTSPTIASGTTGGGCTNSTASFNCVSATYSWAVTVPLLPSFTVPLSANSCYPTASTQ